jgi:hypothetical protein
MGGGGILDAHIRGYRAYADAIEVIAVADVVEESEDERPSWARRRTPTFGK